jgi:hypothetical protein
LTFCDKWVIVGDMKKRRLNAPTTSSNPTHVAVLPPLEHARTVGAAAFVLVLLIQATLALLLGHLGYRVLSLPALAAFMLIAAVAGVAVYIVTYLWRDAELLNVLYYALEDTLGIDLDGDGSVGDPVPRPAPDQYVRTDHGPVARVVFPASWFVTDEMLHRLGQHVVESRGGYSRRELAGIIPETIYTDFSELLVARGILRRAPNKSYALTQGGAAWCRQLARPLPHPAPSE